MEIIKFIKFNKTFHIASLVRHHAMRCQMACIAIRHCGLLLLLLNCTIVINFVRKSETSVSECCICVRLIKMQRLNETNAPAAKRMIPLIHWISSS